MPEDNPAPPPPPAPEPPLSDAELMAIRALLAERESSGGFLPTGMASGQMVATGEGTFPNYPWKLVEPPAASDNQSLKFGVGDPPPYWPTQAQAEAQAEATKAKPKTKSKKK